MNRLLAVLILFAGLAMAPVHAAEPVYPKGMRVGLVPIEGLTLATGFPGFQGVDPRTKVVVAELPKDAYAAIDAAVKANTPTAPGRPKIEILEMPSGSKAFFTRETAVDDGVSVRRYSVLVAGANASGYVAVQVPENAPPAFSEEAVRTMLTTVALRTVPVEEQLSLLPFNTSELANFKLVRVVGNGSALFLSDASDEGNLEGTPTMLISIMSSGPTTPEDRSRFAEQAATSIPGLRETRITSSEPMRIDGTPGYETRLNAITGKDNIEVTVVQWLRFGSGNTTLRMIGIARRSEWVAALARFRSVRDGIGPR